MEGHFSDTDLAFPVTPGRDVIKEFDEEFGRTSKDPNARTSDKSL
jgi:hypothetical protein